MNTHGRSSFSMSCIKWYNKNVLWVDTGKEVGYQVFVEYVFIIIFLDPFRIYFFGILFISIFTSTCTSIHQLFCLAITEHLIYNTKVGHLHIFLLDMLLGSYLSDLLYFLSGAPSYIAYYWNTLASHESLSRCTQFFLQKMVTYMSQSLDML